MTAAGEARIPRDAGPLAAATPKGRRTRARLMEEGRGVLEEHGYFEATVGEIARRSGVALGSFYHYFPNKERLFLLLLEELVEKLYSSTSGSWPQHDDVQLSLRESTRGYLVAYFEDRLLISALLQMAGAVRECADLWWELRTRTYGRMEGYLKQAPGITPESAPLYAAALGTMVENFAYHWYVEAARLGRDLPSIDEASELLGTIWYRSVYMDGGPRG